METQTKPLPEQEGARSESTPWVPSRADLLTMYERMYLIRQFETRASTLYRDGEIPGFVHLAVGQEASAVGACFHLGKDDVITSTHRGHGHVLAHGLTPEEMYAELMAREAGVNRGRGGSMHMADPDRGILGANGIVGAGVPIAAGAAFAAQLRSTGGVVVAFLGDGAISTGAFHEAANLISLWRLPVVLFCENNQFSEFSSFEDQHPVPLATRAQGYGLTYRRLDGNDVVDVSTGMAQILADVRSRGGPYFVESVTLRHGGHYEGDPQLYRNTDTPLPDPLERIGPRLADAGVGDDERLELEARIDARIEAAIAAARLAPAPDPSTLWQGVMADREPAPPIQDATEEPPAAAQWKLFEAVGEAMRVELETDPDVFLAGIDVGKGGNVFALTRGFHDRWPDRMRDTPISESAIVGLGVGAAMAGLRPIVEIMYLDFVGTCMDQLMNQAAKLRFMTGGRAKIPLTVRTQFAAGKSSGAQHSQSLEALLAHIPGLTVIMPSTPADAYGLLRSAIRDPNPVVFIENRLQYGMKGPRCAPDHLVPIGQAALRHRGDDLTIVSYSRMAQVCTQAARELSTQGIGCDVIDLRTIAPLDTTPVLESVARTNRLMVVHEATGDFGVGAEIAARIADGGVWYLDAPIRRVTTPRVPAPYAPSLEAAWLPNKERIVNEAIALLET